LSMWHVCVLLLMHYLGAAECVVASGVFCNIYILVVCSVMVSIVDPVLCLSRLAVTIPGCAPWYPLCCSSFCVSYLYFRLKFYIIVIRAAPCHQQLRPAGSTTSRHYGVRGRQSNTVSAGRRLLHTALHGLLWAHGASGNFRFLRSLANSAASAKAGSYVTTSSFVEGAFRSHEFVS
jgi:hypothetical protein